MKALDGPIERVDNDLSDGTNLSHSIEVKILLNDHGSSILNIFIRTLR